MKLHHSIFLVVTYLVLVQGQGNGDIEVDVPELGGIIQGSVLSTAAPGRRTYYSFSGIPYANPASYTGELNRFKPSEIWDGPLPQNEDGKFIAKNPLVRCPQVDVLNKSNTTDLALILRLWGKRKRDETFETAALPEVRGEEDCLVLNVNTPNLPADPSQLLPVIVFVHGGSWAGLWGGIFGGERFLNKDVLLVTLNYRLGILGSFSLGIDNAPGNAAMYDIINALKWLKRHIRHFGGDPNRVIVTGQSAGAMLASHLLTTPLIRDADDGDRPLIHGLIGLSGSSLSQIATCTDPMTHHLRIAAVAGCHNPAVVNPDLSVVRTCMARKTHAELLEAMAEYSRVERYEGRFSYGARVPSLQDPARLSPSVPLFMTEEPYKVIERSGEINIPIMLGTTRHDGGFLLEETYLQYLEPHNYTDDPIFMRNELVPTLLEGLGLPDPSGELYHTIAKIYLGDAVYRDDFKSKIPGLLDIHSVFVFKASAYQLVEMHSKMNPSSYYFSFEHRGVWTLDGGTVVPGGSGHIDSLFYLFQAYPLNFASDLDVSNRLVNYWTNFAIHGNPNGGPGTLKNTVAPYNPINHPYLIIRTLFDYTGYYCRDGWVDNSLELQAPLPPLPSTTRDPIVSTDSTENSTGDSGGSSIFMLTKVPTLVSSFAVILVLRLINY